MHCYVIGDIHGCLDELRYLVEGLPLESGTGWFSWVTMSIEARTRKEY